MGSTILQPGHPGITRYRIWVMNSLLFIATLWPMDRRLNVLFLQLPQLDNDTGGLSENLMLAAAYLEYAVSRSPEARYHRLSRLSTALDSACTPSLTRAILDAKPDIIAATLYLWNIEWTLRVLRRIKSANPVINIVVGGPEVARHHPFLFRSLVPDVAVCGEGESVFPPILRALRLGHSTNFTTVAHKTAHGYTWGRNPPPPISLEDAIPPAGSPALAPDVNGMAYMETSRGCPMQCTYCRYAHQRRQVSFLAPDVIASRVMSLLGLGAREIRFIDPTFNAHPRFRAILKDLAVINRHHPLRFFAEVMASRLTPDDAKLMAMANFSDVEVGMQSRDPRVLREIHRPTDLARFDRGVRLLLHHRINVTLDIMYALPRQDLRGFKRDIKWALRQQHANIQCLQTLLLPGTELRARRRTWRVTSSSLPPYAVSSTDTLSQDDMKHVEDLVARHPRLRSDVATDGFIGSALPGLFSETLHLDMASLPLTDIPGNSNRRTYLIRGSNFFIRRAKLARFIRRCIREQPDSLFQFVLIPGTEEPLDLLDTLISAIRSSPSHLVDRYASASSGNRIASRRLRILLPPRRRFDRTWIDAVQNMLAESFF